MNFHFLFSLTPFLFTMSCSLVLHVDAWHHMHFLPPCDSYLSLFLLILVPDISWLHLLYDLYILTKILWIQQLLHLTLSIPKFTLTEVEYRHQVMKEHSIQFTSQLTFARGKTPPSLCNWVLLSILASLTLHKASALLAYPEGSSETAN